MNKRRLRDAWWASLALLYLTVVQANASETIAIERSGVVSWNQMLAAENARSQARAITLPNVPPFMPGPPPTDIGPAIGAPVAPGSLASAIEASTGPQPLAFSSPTGFVALPDNNTGIPPDTMGAAGPSHLMTMLNTQVRIQDKTGSNISTVSLSTFWTSGTGLSGSAFDPKLLYDSLSGRWIATVDADARLATSQVWFAISATSDPTGSWSFFGFAADGTGSTWADFPGFGVNSTWIAITNNMFAVPPGTTFAGSKMWVIDKSTALAGGPLTVTVFPTAFDLAGGFTGFSLQPALTFDAAEPKLYLMDSSGLSAGGIRLLRISQITGTGPAPTWSTTGAGVAGTGTFFVANNFNLTFIDTAQLGLASTCSGGANDGLACNTEGDCAGSPCRRVKANDSRAGNVVVRNGSIWTTNAGGLPASGTPDRVSAFWYELDPVAMASSGLPIIQSGVVDGGSGVNHFFPSINVNQNDDACVGFSRGDATTYVEAAATCREGTDSAGTMSTVQTLKAGEDSYFKTFSGTRNRWGDYSATVVDPTDDVTFWTLQEYAAPSVGSGATDDRWGTWWAKLSFAPTPTPTSTPTGTPTLTPTSTPTLTPTQTPTQTPTDTSTPTPTPTLTPTLTPTSTPTLTPTSTPTNTPTSLPVSVDSYVGYKSKAARFDTGGNPIASKLPKPWVITVDDLNVPNSDIDDPENFEVKNTKNLLNPARRDNESGPGNPVLHYIRYDMKLSRHSVGPLDGGGDPVAPAKHVPRSWELLNQFGTIKVESKKVKGLLLPAHDDLTVPPVAPPGDETHYVCYQVKPAKELTQQTPGQCPSDAPLNPRGRCVIDADCGGATCEKPKFRSDLQAFFADEFNDCALDADGGVSFPGQVAEGMCLFDVKKPRELCNPMDKSEVVPPREGVAVISSSTASTTDSLLCYQIRLASKFKYEPVAGFAGAAAGNNVEPKQAKPLPRRVKDGNPVYTAPGNQFTVPTIVDVKGQFMACLPTIVSGVTPLP